MSERRSKNRDNQESTPDSKYVEQFQDASGKQKEEAFTELYNRYDRDLLRYFMKLTQDKKLSTDLKQETFLRALKGLDGFKQKSSFKTWLFHIATNTWRNYIKKNRPVPSGVDEGERTSGTQPDQQAANREREEQVCEAIDNLPEKLRTAFVLVRFEDMKYKEAASALGISLSALKMRIKRATKQLKEALTE